MTRVACMAPSVAISSNRENTRPHSHSRPSAQGPGDRPPHCPPERLPSIQEILSRDDGFTKGALLVLLGFKSAKE